MRGLLTTLFQCSVSMSLITFIYAAILPILSKRYAAKWTYIAWLLIAAGWIIPIRPHFGLLFHSLEIQAIPFMRVVNDNPFAEAGEIANIRTTAPVIGVLVAIWGLGFSGTVLYNLLRHHHFLRMIRRWSEPITDLNTWGIFDRLSSDLGIKKRIGLSICGSVTSPMLVGFFRPVIVLPPINLSNDELSLILKHELIHFKRHDLWYKAMILMATALHWFNPVVYFMGKKAAIQCEVSCDELVLQNADLQLRMQYGESIIGIARNANLQTALSTNFYGGKKDMINRISSIMDIKRKKAGVAVLCLTMVGIIFTGSALAASINRADPQGSKPTVAAGQSNSDKENNIEAAPGVPKDFKTYVSADLNPSKNDRDESDIEIVRLLEELRHRTLGVPPKDSKTYVSADLNPAEDRGMDPDFKRLKEELDIFYKKYLNAKK